jgi:hypothetical protein
LVVVQDDAKEVAQKAAALPKVNGKRDRMVIITQGSKSTVVAYKGEVKEFAVPAVPAEEIVDLNGAGDSFVGGFLAKFTQNKSLVRVPISIGSLVACFAFVAGPHSLVRASVGVPPPYTGGGRGCWPLLRWCDHPHLGYHLQGQVPRLHLHPVSGPSWGRLAPLKALCLPPPPNCSFLFAFVSGILAFFLPAPTCGGAIARLVDREEATRLQEGREEAHEGNGCYFVL